MRDPTSTAVHIARVKRHSVWRWGEETRITRAKGYQSLFLALLRSHKRVWERFETPCKGGGEFLRDEEERFACPRERLCVYDVISLIDLSFLWGKKWVTQDKWSGTQISSTSNSGLLPPHSPNFPLQDPEVS